VGDAGLESPAGELLAARRGPTANGTLHRPNGRGAAHAASAEPSR
jgi:hypothetical protein